ncbi:ATP synthase subunit delta [Bryobacterales bacterium F-183]|nr:ATP synthase subunit delta [Bryobacterales bacterium F-183]
MASLIATRYAAALADSVTAAGTQVVGHAAAEQLRSVEAAVRENGSLRAIFQNPAVSKPRKRAVIGRLSDGLGLSRQIKNFLFVTADRGRIGQLSEIREAFEEILDERLGFVRADISSATALDDGQRQRLEAQLARLAAKQIRPRYSVDPSLVGGVIARVGSTVYDGSVRGQLEVLRRRLTR